MRDFEHLEPCMGTVFRFAGQTDLSDDRFDSAMLTATNSLHKADAVFSLYKEHSPLSQLARGETSVAACPPVVDQVWNLCEHWEKVTDGWFSSFTPDRTFDPSGLVKTWAADYAAQKLLDAGIVDFTMNAGGDVWISDKATGEHDFKVAIGRPVSIASPDAGTLTVLDLGGTEFRAVATSGIAERGQHIWNPRGGELQKDVVQVSVISRDLVEADVWATAAFAEGLRSIDRLNELEHLEALYVLANGEITGTNGMIPLFATPKN